MRTSASAVLDIIIIVKARVDQSNRKARFLALLLTA